MTTWRRILREVPVIDGSVEGDRHVLFHGIVSIESPRRCGKHRPGVAVRLAIPGGGGTRADVARIMTPCLQEIKLS
jgi:hypothetical protein